MPLVGYWPLNESSGSTAYDYSWNGNHVSVENGGDSTVVSGSSFLSQNSYNFDGKNDYASYTSTIVTGPTDLTVSVWFKTSSNVLQEIFHSWTEAFGDVGIRFDSNKVELMYSNSSNDTNNYVNSSSSVPKGEWIHAATTFKQSTDQCLLFLNGNRDASMNVGWDSGVNIYLGSDQNQEDHLKGSISEVRLYDHPLTRKEIQYLYEAGRRGRFRSSSKRV